MWISKILNSYSMLVKSRPISTQVGTAGILITIGDIVAQKVIERRKYDGRRTAVMATCGFTYIGPLVAIWFAVLNRYKVTPLVSVALDQMVVAPFLLSGFLTLQSLLMGKGLRAAKSKIRKDLPSILKVNWMVWIPAQIVNFNFVPYAFRMLFAQVVALFWNCYLSNKTNKSNQIEIPAMIFPPEN